MGALDYAALVDTTVRILGDDARLKENDTDVTDDLEDPTMDQCPSIRVTFRSFSLEPMQMTGALNLGAPFKETVSLEAKCWAFSGESGANAKRQSLQLVTKMLTVLRDNAFLGGLVRIAYATRGDASTAKGERGIFASTTVTIDCLTLS